MFQRSFQIEKYPYRELHISIKSLKQISILQKIVMPLIQQARLMENSRILDTREIERSNDEVSSAIVIIIQDKVDKQVEFDRLISSFCNKVEEKLNRKVVRPHPATQPGWRYNKFISMRCSHNNETQPSIQKVHEEEQNIDAIHFQRTRQFFLNFSPQKQCIQALKKYITTRRAEIKNNRGSQYHRFYGQISANRKIKAAQDIINSFTSGRCFKLDKAALTDGRLGKIIRHYTEYMKYHVKDQLREQVSLSRKVTRYAW